MASCAALAALALGAAAVVGISRLGTSTAPAMRVQRRAPAGERISFTLLLREPGAARLRGELAAIEDPRSPQFRHFLDARSLGTRYGIAIYQLRLLERSLRRDGLRITASYPQRTALTLSGTVAAVSRLLRVGIENYSDGAGQRWHAPLGKPSLPASLALFATGVSGLDTRPAWQAEDVPLGGLTPDEAASAYDVAPLHALGLLGQDQTIAVISFSDYNHADPGSYGKQFGISAPAPRVIAVDEGTTGTEGAGETDLDIDVIRAIAPAAQILVYEVPQSSSAYTDVIDRIVSEHAAEIVSTSWGQCELEVEPSELIGDSQALSAADAAGVSIFAASGDRGAYDCQTDDLSDHRLSVDWPAASAGVISVGGTRLDLSSAGDYLKETAWEYALSNAGGGGGFASGIPRPSWQSAPGLGNHYPNGERGVPDVSADADPGTGWVTYSSAGGCGASNLCEAGGTSAAAPFWAASMLLVTQYALEHGVRRLGYVDPVLYALASKPQPFPPFHDVTEGANRYYQATPGWDPATGLGSPDVYNLARDMVAYLRAHGSP